MEEEDRTLLPAFWRWDWDSNRSTCSEIPHHLRDLDGK